MLNFNEQEIEALKKVAKKSLDPNFASKQITDLELATSFDTGDLLLLRKVGQGVDMAITQQKFIETLGNPSVIGFVATSTIENEVVLTPSNDVVIDKYYNQMVVTFVSPITSTGAVSIKIAGLTNKLMQELGTTTTSTLVTGKYYTAIFDLANNKFYQTNLVVPYIFTNEYIAVGTVQPGETSTKYALTSAIGTSKTATGYYPGMSVLFTANIASKGAVILNIDGLGERSLQDPVGDDIPFNLLANEAIMAIYDGTVFRKRMFTDVEPIDPDPDPADIVVNVGQSRAIKTITDAVTQLNRDYPNGDRTATIQLDTDYIAQVELIQANVPWITVKAAVAGNTIASSIQIRGAGNINFEGTYNIKYSAGGIYGGFWINNTQIPPFGSAKITLKNATLNGIEDVKSHCSPIAFTSPFGTSITNQTIFENVNLNNFTKIIENHNGNTQNFLYKNGVVTMKTNDPAYNGYILNAPAGSITSLQDINFNTITLDPSNNSALITTAGKLDMDNVKITISSDNQIVFISPQSNAQSTITNCTLRNTTTSMAAEITACAPLIIDGGDYKNTTIRVAPDIVAGDYAAAVIRLRNNPLGATSKIGKGQIINE